MAMHADTITAIRKALERDLGDATDNFLRASAAFRGYAPERLNTLYGQSGKTCGEILKEYGAWKTKAQRALDDFNASVR